MQTLFAWENGLNEWTIRTPFEAMWAYTIHDATGRVIHEARSFGLSAYVDHSTMASGVYVIQASTMHGVRLQTKIVKP